LINIRFITLGKNLKNTGALWLNKNVVVDGSLITIRNPDDLLDFNEKLIKEINK